MTGKVFFYSFDECDDTCEELHIVDTPLSPVDPYEPSIDLENTNVLP